MRFGGFCATSSETVQKWLTRFLPKSSIAWCRTSCDFLGGELFATLRSALCVSANSRESGFGIKIHPLVEIEFLPESHKEEIAAVKDDRVFRDGA